MLNNGSEIMMLNNGSEIMMLNNGSEIMVQKNCRRLLKIHYVIAIHLMRWLANFYDFRFK